MDFSYAKELEIIAHAANAFAKQYILPHRQEWDKSQTFPIDVFRKAGELGFMGILVPEAYGGSGLGYHEYITIVDEISQIDPSIGLSIAAHNSLCVNHLLTFASEEQKKRWLPKLASGEHIGAWGITEHNTGSDAGGMLTTAVKQGEEWVLNGTKNFITHAISADVVVVIARTGEKGDKHGMTAFVVERGTPGFSNGKKIDKLGMRASETAELVFQNCRIPDQNRIGAVGEGFIQAMKILDGGRISIGALSLGTAKGAVKAAIQYAKERSQFGKPIISFQAIGFKLAELSTEIKAAELMLHKAAHLKETQQPVTQQAAMAKLYASELCVKASNEAIQIHGGYGYTTDYPVEKFYRDAKLCTIGEGTSEILKLVISRKL